MLAAHNGLARVRRFLREDLVINFTPNGDLDLVRLYNKAGPKWSESREHCNYAIMQNSEITALPEHFNSHENCVDPPLGGTLRLPIQEVSANSLNFYNVCAFMHKIFFYYVIQ